MNPRSASRIILFVVVAVVSTFLPTTAAFGESLSLSLSLVPQSDAKEKFFGVLQDVKVGDILVITRIDGNTPPIFDVVTGASKGPDGRTVVEVNENPTSSVDKLQSTSSWVVYVIPKENVAAFYRRVSTAASVLSAK